MTQANYALRLQASIKAEAERLAKAEGTTLNQFINVADAEKVAALRTADFFRERARRAERRKTILEVKDRWRCQSGSIMPKKSEHGSRPQLSTPTFFLSIS